MADDSKKPSKGEQVDSFIAEFELRYGEQCDLARAAAETTATPAFSALYESQIKGHREIQRRCVNVISATAKLLETRESDEDSEKEIKDAVKQLSEERERYTAWYGGCVRPLSQCVKTAEQIRDDCVRSALNLQSLQPLVYAGLVELVQKRMGNWPVLAFDEATGRVSIRETSEGQNREAA